MDPREVVHMLSKLADAYHNFDPREEDDLRIAANVINMTPHYHKFVDEHGHLVIPGIDDGIIKYIEAFEQEGDLFVTNELNIISEEREQYFITDILEMDDQPLDQIWSLLTPFEKREYYLFMAPVKLLIANTPIDPNVVTTMTELGMDNLKKDTYNQMVAAIQTYKDEFIANERLIQVITPIIDIFTRIDGIRVTTAVKYINQGITTIAQLWPLLDRKQQLSYYYYEQLTAPFTDDEFTEGSKFFQSWLSDHQYEGTVVKFVTVRGIETGYVIIVTGDNFEQVYQSFIADGLIIVTDDENTENNEWNGILKTPRNAHQGLIRVVSSRIYGGVILNYEDSDNYYKKRAARIGLVITDNGIFDDENELIFESQSVDRIKRQL